jgi:hypothetical protein
MEASSSGFKSIAAAVDARVAKNGKKVESFILRSVEKEATVSECKENGEQVKQEAERRGTGQARSGEEKREAWKLLPAQVRGANVNDGRREGARDNAIVKSGRGVTQTRMSSGMSPSLSSQCSPSRAAVIDARREGARGR